MKERISSIALGMVMLMLVGCTSSTEYGECIGMFDTKKPGIEYKLSGWNAFVSLVLGSALIWIPTIFWVKDSTFCPVGRTLDLPR